MNGLVRWLRTTSFGVSRGEVLFTSLLSLYAVVLVATQSTAGACLAALGMVVPVAFARRAPLAASVTIAVATLANELLFGHLVRCGPALPAAFFVAYTVGRRATGAARPVGLGCLLAGVAWQCVDDPRLGGAQLALMGSATALFFAAGLAVRWRSYLVAELRERNRELRAQRERTAEAAVAADRARIRSELIGHLQDEIHAIVQLADCDADGPTPTPARLEAIERTGRAALDRMRDIVGTIQSAPIDPEPGLDALPDLLHVGTRCEVQLVVRGDARPLPASIELSAYRIVEHLIAALPDEPMARAQVRIGYCPESVELAVVGPMASDADPAKTYVGLADRVDLHGGVLRVGSRLSVLDVEVQLPLVSRYA